MCVFMYELNSTKNRNDKIMKMEEILKQNPQRVIKNKKNKEGIIVRTFLSFQLRIANYPSLSALKLFFFLLVEQTRFTRQTTPQTQKSRLFFSS